MVVENVSRRKADYHRGTEKGELKLKSFFSVPFARGARRLRVLARVRGVPQWLSQSFLKFYQKIIYHESG
jgi:hypothetical protein